MTSKVISLFAGNNGSYRYNKLIWGLFSTVIVTGMIIDIPLYNRERYITHFVSEILPFVCEYPYRIRTLLNFYSKSYNMKCLSLNKNCACFHILGDIITLTLTGTLRYLVKFDVYLVKFDVSVQKICIFPRGTDFSRSWSEHRYGVDVNSIFFQ